MSAQGAKEPHEIPCAVVAYLDVLGTKGIPSGPTAVDYAKRLQDFRDFADSQVKGAMGLVRAFYAVVAQAPGLVEESVDHFSDSTFLWVRVDKDREIIALSEVATILTRLMHYGLANNLPLRGAVSIGPLAVGDGIFVGEAVAEAVEWERVAQWSGVIFAPSATGPVIELAGKSPDDPRLADFAWAQVPTHGTPLAPGMKLLALAWPNGLPQKYRSRIDRMYLWKPLPIDAAAKYLNTMVFIDHVHELAAAGRIPRPNAGEEYIVRSIWDGL